MKLKKLAWAGLISLTAIIATAGIAGAANGDKLGLQGIRSWAFPANSLMTCDKPAGGNTQAEGLVKGFVSYFRLKGFALFETAAKLLGLEPQELQKELQSGKTLRDIASALGIAEDKFVGDMEAAVTAEIDQALADGKISAEQAAELKDNLSQLILDLLAKKWPEGKGPRFGSQTEGKWGYQDRSGPENMLGVRGPMPEIFAEVQTLLNLETSELRTELQSGKSLAEIAQAQGVAQATLIEKIQTAITEDLDQAVADKKLSAEAAAKIKENLTQRITDMVTKNHPPRESAPGHGHTESLAGQTSNI
jgi:transcriptional regulator with XRE-family HTH domain